MNLGILSKVFEQIPVTENKFAKYGIRKTNRIFDPVIALRILKRCFNYLVIAESVFNELSANIRHLVACSVIIYTHPFVRSCR